MNNVMFSSVTFNWRDIISPPSYALVRNNLKMSEGFVSFLSVCILFYYEAFNALNKKKFQEKLPLEFCRVQLNMLQDCSS